MPSSGDLLVGWVLVASALSLSPFPWSATLLASASTLWSGVGLATYLGPMTELVQRAALLPTALLTVVVIVLPRQLPRSSSGRLAAGAALGAAVVGGTGVPGAMVAIGLTALVVGVVSGRETAGVGQVGFGLGLVVAGVWGQEYGGVSAASQATLHQLVMGGGALLSVWVLRSSALLVGSRRVASHGLGPVLAEALGIRSVSLAFPSGGGWIDEAGRPVQAPSSGRPVSTNGQVLAWWTPSPVIDEPPGPALVRVLTAASRTARLRAELLDQADQIAGSRSRLASASGHERDVLAEQLRQGALLRLSHTAHQIASLDPLLARRFREAADSVAALISGLDPVQAAGGLVPSLAALCERAGASLELEQIGTPDDETARVIWFVCAEALANVAKHAAGARASVSLGLDASVLVLEVADDGPGGADLDGTGLAGLRARAAGAGGLLKVASSSKGTTLILIVPAARFPSSDVAVPLIQQSSASERVIA